MLSALERFLLPAVCLTCQRPVTASGDPVLCAVCRSRFRAISPPWCERCGEPTLADLPCRLCTTWPDGFHAARSIYWLDDGLRRAIHGLKYDGFSRLGRELGPSLARVRFRDLDRSRAYIVPVPLGQRRQRLRSYNQAEELARGLAQVWGRPLRADILIRRRETRSQTTLTPEERLANVSGAFRLRAGYRSPHPIVLVDDVFTTGATLAEAARAILEGGMRNIFAVTLGRATPRDFTKEKKSWPFGLA